MQWIEGTNGNKASVEFWGSEEAARESLETLTDCRNCSDCSRCSRCSGCSDCSDCSRCYGCSGCSRMIDVAGYSPAKVMAEIPVVEGIHQKLLTAITAEGCNLDMSDWHTCETAHCRAGWVVHLAGKPGYDLQRLTSASHAAQQIYKASGYEISPNRFYDDDDKAMANIKELAELENAGAAPAVDETWKP